MFVHLKRLFKHSVVYGLAETISRGTSSILILIYTRFLSPEEMGVRALLFTSAALLSLFYTMGLDNSFLRYFMDREYENRRDEILSTALYFTLAMGLVFLAAAFLFDDTIARLVAKSASYAYLVRLLFLIMIFDSVVIYPTLILRAEGNTWYYSFIAFSRFVLFVVFNLLSVVFMKRGLNGIFEANLIVVILIAILLFPVFRANMGKHLSRPILRTLLIFGVPTIFTLLAMRIIDRSAVILIAYLLGEEGEAAAGVYSVAYATGVAGVLVFVNSFRLAWQPFFLSVKEDLGARAMFSRIATYYTMSIGMVFLGIALFRREIFHLLAPGWPDIYAGLLPLGAVACIFFGFYLIMNAGVFIREKTKYLPIATIVGAAVNIGLNFLFIPWFGVYGAAYTSIAAYAIMVAILYFISRRIYQVDYEFGRLVIAGTAVLLPALLPELFMPESYWAGVSFRCALLLFPPLVYFTGGFLRPDERHALAAFRESRFGGARNG